MRRALLLLFAAGALSSLLLCAAEARSKASRGARKEPAAEKSAASPETLEMVDAFLKAKTEDLPADFIPAFMEVDPKSLPSRMRDRFLAKREELRALGRVAQSHKKAGLRRLGKKEEEAQCVYKEGSEQLVRMMKQTGFSPISDTEEEWLVKETKCTECELQEEFSLTIYFVPAKKKGGRPTRHLLLHEKDILMGMVGRYRNGAETAFGTKFFGVGMTPACR